LAHSALRKDLEPSSCAAFAEGPNTLKRAKGAQSRRHYHGSSGAQLKLPWWGLLFMIGGHICYTSGDTAPHSMPAADSESASPATKGASGPTTTSCTPLPWQNSATYGALRCGASVIAAMLRCSVHVHCPANQTLDTTWRGAAHRRAMQQTSRTAA
jgi:hypothetical protein